MSAENWHEERERLARLLDGLDSGEITHLDADGSLPLERATPTRVELLRKRLETLNDRLEDKDGQTTPWPRGGEPRVS